MSTQVIPIVLLAVLCMTGCDTPDQAQPASDNGQTVKAAQPAVEPSSDAAVEKQAEERFYQAADAYQQQQYDRAVVLFSEVIALMPDNPQAYHNRGTCYEELGEWDKAIHDYDEAIRLDPQYVQAYNSRGNAHVGGGDPQRAREDYQKVLEFDPNHADAHYNLANLAEIHNEAIAHYDAAIRSDPQYARAYHNRGARFLMEGDAQRAAEDFTAAIAIDPNYAQAYFNRATAYRELGQSDPADADLARARELDPVIAR